jgi:hypothetical protein
VFFDRKHFFTFSPADLTQGIVATPQGAGGRGPTNQKASGLQTCTHTHTHLHTQTYKNIYTPTQTYKHTHLHTKTYKNTHQHTQTFTSDIPCLAISSITHISEIVIQLTFFYFKNQTN